MTSEMIRKQLLRVERPFVFILAIVLVLVLWEARFHQHLDAVHSRISTVEMKLEAPRFHAGDGMVTVECLSRGLHVADLFLRGLEPAPASDDLPVIKRDMARCHRLLEELVEDLQRRGIK